MKIDSGFKQLFRATLAADTTRAKPESQDASVMPIEALRTKLGERAVYDPAVLRLPAFFGTGGPSSDQLRLRPPEKASSSPHEVTQAVERVRRSIERAEDPRFSNFVAVLRTLEGFQRTLRPRTRNLEG